jgi:DNA repair exonuclease SbcCD ATPase subunit
MDLAATAAALYALPLDEFTRARDIRAKEAAAAGDKDLGGEIRKLKKASTAAWLVNLLVEHHREEIEQVVALGDSLREAQETADRARLHALGQQRQRLLAAVARQSLDLAAGLGHPAGASALPEVEQTLRAAMTDPAAAAAVLTGRLVRPLEVSGWEPVDLAGAVAGGFDAHPGALPAAAHAGGRSRRNDERAARLEQALRDLTEVEARAEQAAEEAEAAQQRARRIAVKREGLEASIEDLRERLRALQREMDGVDQEVAEAEESRAAAVRDGEAARAEMTEARAAVAKLRRGLPPAVHRKTS